MSNTQQLFKEYCLSLWRDGNYGELHRMLVRKVAIYYWKYTAELYRLFGFLGQSAGIGRDWDETKYLPDALPNAEQHLVLFLNSLTEPTIPLQLSPKAKKIKRTLLRQYAAYGSCVCWIPYHQILMKRSEYEAAGARIYLEFLNTAEWEFGVTGMLAIYTQGLNCNKIQADMIMRRTIAERRRRCQM